MMSRKAYFQAYYLAHRAILLERSRAAYEALKGDKVAYGKRIKQERQYKRSRFGWVRVYQKRAGVSL